MRSVRSLVLLAFVAATGLTHVCVAAITPASFKPRQSISLSTSPLWTACGDFDGDGQADVATGRNGGTAHQITTFFGQFPAVQQPGIASATAGAPTRLSAGDFNGDGRADLIYLDDNSGLKIIYAQPNRTFGVPTTIGPSNGSADPWGKTAVADLNNDGRLDAMIAYSNSTTATGGIAIARQLPGGGFSVSNIATNSDPYGIATADLNHDGFADIIVGDNGGGKPVKVAYGSIAGTYTVKSFTYGDRGYGVVAKDFNGDGIPDVAVAAYNSSAAGVMLTQANGDLGPVTLFPATTTPDSIATGDFNGDGVADLVLSSEQGSGVSVLLGNGSGGFVSGPNLFASGSGTSTVSVADLDGNGSDDIVVAAAGSQNLDIFYNSVPEPTAFLSIAGFAIQACMRRRR